MWLPRWRLLVALLAGLGVIAALLLVPGEERRIAAPQVSATPLPAGIAAMNERFELVELSALDGSTRRVIAPGIDAYHGGESIAVPNPSYALVGGLRHPNVCPDNSDPDAATFGWIDLTSGQSSLRPLAGTARSNRAPTATLDGTRVAFIEEACNNPTSLIIMNRDGEQLAKIDEPVSSGVLTQFGDIADWDAEGRRLVVRLLRTMHPTTSASWFAVDTSASAGATLEGREVTSDPDVLQLARLGASARWVAVIGGAERRSQARLVEFDIANGQVVRELFKWSTAEDAIVRVAAVDRSGDHLLLTAAPVQVRDDGNLLSAGRSVLYRWSRGDSQPTKLVDGTYFAAWLPSANAPSSTSTTTTAAASAATSVPIGGTLFDGRSWSLYHDAAHGLCLTIATEDFGCDDEGPVISPDADPAAPRTAVEPGPFDTQQAGFLLYAYLPAGATYVVLHYGDGRTSSIGLVIEPTARFWAIPITSGDNPATVSYVRADGTEIMRFP